MKQTQVVRTSVRTAPRPLDTRTPSGRELPW